jgi:dUTP diphosphatase
VSDESPASGVDVLLLRLDASVPVPTYAHPGDAGADLVTTADADLAPGERAVLPTGVALALPAGYAAFVHARSGLAARCGVALVNAPGTIDAGYRGELKVIVINLDPREPVRFRRGDRIAQLVIQRVERATFHEVDVLPGTARGTGGHGSTGGHADARAMPAGAAQAEGAPPGGLSAAGADTGNSHNGGS